MEISTPDSDELSLVYGKKGFFTFLSTFNEFSEKDKHKINFKFVLREPLEELTDSKSRSETPSICGKNSIFRKFEKVCSNNLIKVESSQHSESENISE